MARMALEEATGLTVADVIHQRFSALPADATVAQLRDYFAESSSRKIAVLADDGRFAGTITREDVDGDADPLGPAAALASPGPTADPGAPAHVAHELALTTAALRVAVVDRDGTLLGVVGVTDDRAAFCGAK